MPVLQGLEKDAKEAVEMGLLERDGLIEALTVLDAYVKEVYVERPDSLKMVMDKMKDKLELVEGHLRHYRALLDSPEPDALETRPAEPVESAVVSKD